MATKKSPAKSKPAPKPKVSSITRAAQKAVLENESQPGLAAALAVLKALRRRALDKPGVLKFLNAAYDEVKAGGGQDGGTKADPAGPQDPPTTS